MKATHSRQAEIRELKEVFIKLWMIVMGLNISKRNKQNVDKEKETSGDKILRCIDDIISQRNEKGKSREDEDDPFFIVDLDDIEQKHKLWKRELPKVQPFYAVKCNPDRRVLETLAKLGAGFDCASKNEIIQVLDQGVHPSRIIFANPCKAESHLRFAKENDVYLMTFDNEEELTKVKRVFPTARLVLRIWAEDKTAVCPLSMKFGCKLSEVRRLFEAAKRLQLLVEGISFHVGNGSGDPESYYTAINDVREAYDIGLELGHDLRLVDIGGGFPGKTSSSVPFEKYSAAAKRGITDFFPDSDKCNPQIIGEPGTFYVQSAFCLAVCVIGKRDLTKYPLTNPKDFNRDDIGSTSESLEVAYYLNSSVYSSLKDAFLISTKFKPIVLKTSNSDGRLRPSMLWGNTTSREDCIRRECLLPDLEEGDWIVFRDMGAYEMAISSTNYCGFNLPQCYTA